MRNALLVCGCATAILLVTACGDDTGGGSGGAGGDATATATNTPASSGNSTAAATDAASTGQGGNSGGGGEGGSGLVVSPDLACPDTDLEEEDLGTGTDPEDGDFTLEEALDGLPEGDGPLRAIISTDYGDLTCELFPEIAPIGVANFVGLARGRRAFEDPEEAHWIRGRRFYDGLTFHRVIDDFVAQGGDPQGNGFGGPGYEFVSETDNDESHTPGTLSYANAGADSNGSQFFIVAEEPADFLDGDYTIFGRCSLIRTVRALTEVPKESDDETPVDPPIMNRVHITRCAPQ